jgi:Tat protein translocase TatB subunit
VFLLILESLGSTELFFILIMALVFFGPRKLPQLSRTLGKNIAEFRRASEDFKRTWEREVALEDIQSGPRPPSTLPEGNSILNPVVEPPQDEIIARDSSTSEKLLPVDTSTGENLDHEAPEAPRKQDWL